MSKQVSRHSPDHSETGWDLFWLFFLFIIFVSFLLRGAPPTAKEIMVKHQDARKIPSVKASAKIKTGGGGKKENIKEFVWWRKLKADGQRYNTLTRFDAPAEVRGQAILFQELENQKNDIQMYLPAYKKVRRVESNQQSSSFMGSEFSYSDITTPHIDDYKYSLEKEESCPQDSKQKCFVIESVPSTQAVMDRSQVGKSLAWVRKDNHMVEKAEYFDTAGALWKVLKASDFRPVKGEKWFVGKIHMENVKSGRFTDLDFGNLETDKEIPDRFFTVGYLQAGP